MISVIACRACVAKSSSTLRAPGAGLTCAIAAPMTVAATRTDRTSEAEKDASRLSVKIVSPIDLAMSLALRGTPGSATSWSPYSVAANQGTSSDECDRGMTHSSLDPLRGPVTYDSPSSHPSAT